MTTTYFRLVVLVAKINNMAQDRAPPLSSAQVLLLKLIKEKGKWIQDRATGATAVKGKRKAWKDVTD